MVDTNPSTGPNNNKGQRVGLSVMVPADLWMRLERQAQASDETVKALASRLVKEALRSMP